MVKSEYAAEAIPWWLAPLCVAALLMGIVDREVWTPDEPRAAAISLSMAHSSDFVIPRLGAEPFVEKPPLYFAVAGLSARIFGPLLGNTGAIRMTTALWGLGVLWMSYKLSRRVYGRKRAILTVAILSTMVGFVENMHWIRVDAALAFFVVAAVWGFSEVYLGNRPWLCLWAGLCTSGAFLSKGAIGPLLVGMAWLGLVIPWLVERYRTKRGLFVAQHLFALLLFILPAVWWMILFRERGGPALWHTWFYENHFGRLTGTAKMLGHIHRNPLYYIQASLVYALPWLPAFAIVICGAARDLIRRRPIPRERIFLLVWCLGSILLLTLSQSKRQIYLAPVLPAFALLCSGAFVGARPRWATIFSEFWVGLCLVLLAACMVAPFVARFLPDSVPPSTVAALGQLGWRNILVALATAAGIGIAMRRRSMHATARIGAVTALLWIGVLAVPAQAINATKSPAHAARDFVSHIPLEERTRVAGWRLSETDRAVLYYYGDLTAPLIGDKSRLEEIIKGTDPDFDSVVLSDLRSLLDALPALKYNVLAQADVGRPRHPRLLQWVEGNERKLTP